MAPLAGAFNARARWPRRRIVNLDSAAAPERAHSGGRADACESPRSKGALIDGAFVLLGLMAFVAFLLGPIGFFLSLGARTRLRRVEDELARLTAKELTRAQSTPRESPRPAPQVAEAAPARVEPAPARVEPAAPPPPRPHAEAEPAAAPPQPAPAPNAAAPRPGLEEKLGARWAVIVGGIALALGALLLVKYSIDQGYLGPAVRVVAGLVLGAALVAAGEWLRRNEHAFPTPKTAVPIPAVLTGAGTVAAFGSLYAAHALYGFIGPAAAFALLGAVGVATMLAAALHGPALAGLGLVGALGAPLLVSSATPHPWPVVLYVAVVTGAAYGLARLRRWLWLAIAAGVGAALWQVLFLAGPTTVEFHDASLVHLLAEAALALGAFVVAPHAATPESRQVTDPVASLAALAVGFVALLTLAATQSLVGASALWVATAVLLPAMLALAGFRFPAAAAASAVAGAVIVAALFIWGANGVFAVEARDAFTLRPQPGTETSFIVFGALMSLALAGLCFLRLLDDARLSFLNSAIYAASGALTPLAALSVMYLRLRRMEPSPDFAGAALALGALMSASATRFERLRARDASPAIALGLGALASGAFAALSLALVFALSQGTLTVALALAALGAAFVSERLKLPILRWVVLAFGVLVAGRLLYDPRIVGDALGNTILFNWLLFGYGVPAVAFGLAARLMRRSGEDPPLRVAQSLSILCSALLVALEIRHALNGGDPFAQTSGLIEQGLFALVGILFSAVLMELNARRADPVYAFASLAFGGLTLLQAAVGLLLVQNPYFSGEAIEGGALFNGLLLGYALPALAAAILARRAIGQTPAWRRPLAAAASIAFAFAYLNLELRRLFQGDPRIGLFRSTSDGEFYAYSAAWLAVGILLLVYALWARSKPARYASAALVALTVVKVFVLDMASLEGPLRALSFLGLGGALIGIGFVYQRFVFVKPAAPAA